MTWLLVYLCINAAGCSDGTAVVVNGIPPKLSADAPYDAEHVRLGPNYDTYATKEECERSSPYLSADKDHIRMCVTGGKKTVTMLGVRVDEPKP